MDERLVAPVQHAQEFRIRAAFEDGQVRFGKFTRHKKPARNLPELLEKFRGALLRAAAAEHEQAATSFRIEVRFAEGEEVEVDGIVQPDDLLLPFRVFGPGHAVRPVGTGDEEEFLRIHLHLLHKAGDLGNARVERENQVPAGATGLEQTAHDRIGMGMRMTQDDVAGPDIGHGRRIREIVENHVGPLFEKAEDAVGDRGRGAQRGVVPGIAGIGEVDARTVRGDGRRRGEIKRGPLFMDDIGMADSHKVDVDAVRLVVVAVEPLLIKFGESVPQKVRDQRLGDPDRMAGIELVGHELPELFRTEDIVAEEKDAPGFEALEDAPEDGGHVEAVLQDVRHDHEIILLRRMKLLDGTGDRFDRNAQQSAVAVGAVGVLQVVLDQRIQQRDVAGPDVRQDEPEIGERSAAQFDDAGKGAAGNGPVAAEIAFVVVVPVILGVDQVGHPRLALVSLGFLPAGAVHLNDALLGQVLEVVALAQPLGGGGAFEDMDFRVDEDRAWFR